MYQDYLKTYARLIVKIGLNLQENQELLINSTAEASDLLEEIIEVAATECKCGPIHVNLTNDAISRKLYEVQSVDTLSNVPNYKEAQAKEMVDKNAARLSLACPNPTLLKGIDPQKISSSMAAASKVLKKYGDEMQKKQLSWNVAAYVNDAWAKQVFPDLELAEAKAKLWDLVYKACRVYDADPVASWQAHIDSMAKYAKFLNENKIKTVHYKSSLTDFYVDMPENYIFESAGDKNNYGLPYVPNIPTEEVFSAPHMLSARGRLHSTMPLNVRGNLIENFWFDFENGSIVDFGADSGYETLELLINTDEGARRLGEIALVPVDSPISNLNTLFYNTLFDENASCHFALGSAYKSCVKGGLEMDKDQAKEAGLNDSLIHVDFMVGASDLSITAVTEEGKEVSIFTDGNWSF